MNKELFSRQVYNKYLIFPAALGIVLIDQVSKIIVRSNLMINERFVLIPDIFNLTHAENTGAAFSLFSGQVEVLTLISILAIVVMVVYCVLEHNQLNILQLLGWGFLLGGTIGNLIDRLFLGSVTDFFDFTLINFPVFNFADVFIDTGAFIIILLSLFCNKKAD